MVPTWEELVAELTLDQLPLYPRDVEVLLGQGLKLLLAPLL